MQDIQNEADHRKIPIDKVGVCDLRYPIVVLDRQHRSQSTIANLSMSVNLPHEFKGTHMSRFIEILNASRGEVTMRTLPTILSALKRKLAAQSAFIEISFPYFLEREAPVSGSLGLMDYQCKFICEANGSGEDFILSVQVPVTSLCPCSKAISDYGAHNQRGEITVEIRTRQDAQGFPELVWIEEIVEIAESSASAPVYALLKREDERFLTMKAYDNPMFVEDIVRNVASNLQKDDRISWFRVYVQNQESIHNHSAFAQVQWFRA